MIEALLETAREAGLAAKQCREGKAFQTFTKADRSFVTSADLLAQDVVVKCLKRLDATIPVISEELPIPPYEERRGWNKLWLIDPVDGTREFINGGPDYTVNIALVVNGEPTIGVIYAPDLDTLYYAQKSLGAYKIERSGSPQRIYSTAVKSPGPFAVIESRSHRSEELEAFLSTIEVKGRVRLGSSLKFCHLAEGKADLYARFGRIMEWDTAAGDCIFRQSARPSDGRSEAPERTSTLRYNTEPLSNGSFVLGP